MDWLEIIFVKIQLAYLGGKSPHESLETNNIEHMTTIKNNNIPIKV